MCFAMVAHAMADDFTIADFSIKQGETKTVSVVIPANELAFVGGDGKWRLEEGDFRLSCGGLGVMVRCSETKVWETPNI